MRKLIVLLGSGILALEAQQHHGGAGSGGRSAGGTTPVAAPASRPYGPSAGGFGNVLFPGGAPGHATPGNITNPGFAGALGATVRGGAPQVGGPMQQRRGGPAVRTYVVPYPVSYFPYGYGYAPEPPIQEPQPQPPVVVINQNFRPDTVNPQFRDYSNANLPPAAEQPTLKVWQNAPARKVEDEQPTIYLIAMKDGSVMTALGYWLEGDTLNYITRDKDLNRVSIDRVDRDFSVKLNQERGLEFRLR